jgi:hypothetical protein
MRVFRSGEFQLGMRLTLSSEAVCGGIAVL